MELPYRAQLIVCGFIKQLKCDYAPSVIIEVCLDYYHKDHEFKPISFSIHNSQNIKMNTSTNILTFKQCNNLNSYAIQTNTYYPQCQRYGNNIFSYNYYDENYYFTVKLLKNISNCDFQIGFNCRKDNWYYRRQVYHLSYSNIAYVVGVSKTSNNFSITKHETPGLHYPTNDNTTKQHLFSTEQLFHKNDDVISVILNFIESKLYFYVNNILIQHISVPSSNCYPIIWFPENKHKHKNNNCSTFEIVQCYAGINKYTHVEKTYIFNFKSCQLFTRKDTIKYWRISHAACSHEMTPELILELLWNGYKLLNLDEFNDNLSDLIQKIKLSSFDKLRRGYNYIRNDKIAVDLWVFVEIYRHFKKKYYELIYDCNIVNNDHKIISIIVDYVMDNFDNDYMQYTKNLYEYLRYIMIVHGSIYRNDVFCEWINENVVPNLLFDVTSYQKVNNYDNNDCVNWDEYDYDYTFRCDPYEVCVYFDKSVNLWENEYIKRKFNNKRKNKKPKEKKYYQKWKKKLLKMKRQSLNQYIKKKQYL